MKTTERLKALAEKAISAEQEGNTVDEDYEFTLEANPATINELCELVERTEEALSTCCTEETWLNSSFEKCGGQQCYNETKVAEALSRVAKFQKGE